MAQDRAIITGDIISGAFRRLGAHRESVLVYLLIFVLLGTVANWADVLTGQIDQSVDGFDELRADFAYGGFGLLYLIAGTVGHYWLFGKLLDNPQAASLGDVGRWVLFIGLAIVSWLGVAFATVFLIFPGLFLASRWLMSPAIYVDRRTGVFEALGESWRATRGNTTPVLLSLVVIVLMLIVVAVVLGALTLIESTVVTAFVDAFITELFGVLTMGMSVTVYAALVGRDREVADVFA